MGRKNGIPVMILAAAVLAALLILVLTREPPLDTVLPGTQSAPRRLLVVWETGGMDGVHTWLTKCASAAEKAMPGLTVYLRRTTPEEALREGVVLPDVMIFTGGAFDTPEKLFQPLTGDFRPTEAFMRSAKWRETVYALPVAASPWVLTMDAALLPGEASTPAPTTLLGRPAPTDAPSAPVATPEAPWLSDELGAIAARDGAGLFSLLSLTEESPRPLLSAVSPYQAMLGGSVRAALMNSVECAALLGAVSGGRRAPVQVYVPQEALAPQVLYAAMTVTASEDAAGMFMSFLTETLCQQLLAERSLCSVCAEETLYLSGTPALMEQSLRRGVYPVNAFAPQSAVDQSARDAWDRRTSPDAALAALM